MIRTRLAALAIAPLAALTVLTGCSGAPTTAPDAAPAAPATGQTAASGQTGAGDQTADAAALLAALGLEGLSGREVVETLDQLDQPRPLPVSASVRSDEVLLSDGNREASIPLEGEEFYLSLAPYETRTHDCWFHNLGTCRGELAETPVHVTITTDAGEVLVDADATTYANGFVGFWIPKGVSGTIVVTKDGLTATSPFSSDAEGATCVTTLPLT